MRTTLCAVRVTPVLLFCVLATSTLLLSISARAQAPAAEPALLQGEIFALTQNGCGIVLNTGGEELITTYGLLPDGSMGNVQMNARDYIASNVWSGDCSGGLAQGWGKYGPPGDAGIDSEFWLESEYAYGRDLGRYKSSTHEIHYSVAGANGMEQVTLKKLGEQAVEGPQWVTFEEDIWGGSSISNRQINVRTNATNCFIDREKFRGCRGEGYPVYGVTVQTLGEGGEAVDHWCPNPKTTKGCEALWEELAGPSLTQAKAQIGQWEQRTQAAVQQYAEISAPWLAQEPERAAARQEAQLAARAAEAQAQAEAEQLRQLQAQEAAAAFEEQLAAANAGELFILSQDLDAEGRSEEARLARRALITRFPDNALAATAAQQMMATPAPAAPAAELGIERCQQAENASNIPSQLASLPSDNTNLQTRGIVVAADFMIATYSACLPDAQAQAIVDQYRSTRESALATCRAVSTVDNCLTPPFGAEYEADLLRQQQEAARMQAEYESAQDALELQQSIENLFNVIDQIEGGGSDAGGGDECTFNSDGDEYTVCTAQ